MTEVPGVLPSTGPSHRSVRTHVGSDDDEGPQIGPFHIPRHIAEVRLEVPEQLRGAPLTPLDLFPRCLCSRGQEGTACVDNILGRTDRQIDGIQSSVLRCLVLRWSKPSPRQP